MDTSYNMKGKYELELISTCSMKHYHFCLISIIQNSTKLIKKSDFRLEKISYNDVKTNHGKLLRNMKY